MNFIFISPQFPLTHWQFCDRLKKKGVNVLGIGDGAYDALNGRLKDALTEYYKVESLEDYEQVYRAVAFFAWKYGKIDGLESNNEYWLSLDAKLRTDFHILSGFSEDVANNIRKKSQMKNFFKQAGIPVADYIPVTTMPEAEAFAGKVGFPLVVKPEIGIGSKDTHRLRGWPGLEYFFNNPYDKDTPFIMEQYLEGDIISYDALIGLEGEPLYEAETIWPPSNMDVVNRHLDMSYYTKATISPELKEAGRAAVKAFGVKGRIISFEFFRLTKDCPGVGKIGDLAALEANMTPAAGYTLDMLDFMHSIDLYEIWADMITGNTPKVEPKIVPGGCVYAGRRQEKNYAHSTEEIHDKYQGKILLSGPMPRIMSALFGNEFFMARCDTIEEKDDFLSFVHEIRMD